MSLICPAGKVRLRLRSASLTTICHSTPPPPTSPASPHSSLLRWGRLSFNLAADGDGQDEGDGGGGGLRAGRACGRGRGDIVRGEPVGLFGSGAPLSLPLSVLAAEEVASPASLMKAVDAPRSSTQQPKSLLPATGLDGGES